MAKHFVAVYTNECKRYCDDIFFRELQRLTGDRSLHVVDNSLGLDYVARLKTLCPQVDSIEHIEVDREPKISLFQRNVFHSVARLREMFLASESADFVILESDVVPPHDLLALFETVIDQADIIGGIYYAGFHTTEAWDPHNMALEKVGHVLSGCTLYTREVIARIPFRWDPETLAAFPDAFMSFDAVTHGFRLANYNKIKCTHLHALNGHRGWEHLR